MKSSQEEMTPTPGDKRANEIVTQRNYYARTAADYDAAHLAENDEHYFALAVLLGVLEYLDARSVLDIGAGTGRAMSYLQTRRPDLHVTGVEPVKELREVAYSKGIQPRDLGPGDALNLDRETSSVDVVCAFGVLHHVREPGRAVAEMLRVARRAVFISDGNNFGQGGFLVRSAKQLLHAVRLWKVANWAKTRGKGYTISEGDGLAYSYSVFNNYRFLKSNCRSVHLVNTTPAGVNPYRSASQVALLAIK